MSAFAGSARLIEVLGDKGLIELDAAIDEVGQQWKGGVLDVSADRFERRLAVELSAFRVEVSKELAAARVEVSKELAAMRVEISSSKLSTIRWVAGLLIAHAGVIVGATFAMMTFLVEALKAN